MVISKKTPGIGRFFTPINWAKWLVDKHGVYDAWKNGASIIDPTCGQGAFFIALMELARDRGDIVTAAELDLLTGVEINAQDKETFLKKFKKIFDQQFPETNFISADFLHYENHCRFDIAIGNPPWANFSDLPDWVKHYIGQLFIYYGLVSSKKDVLLGQSRADIASLVIQKCMKDHVNHGGRGYFFVPMSLFFNEGANKNFRPIPTKEGVFSVDGIFDFPKPIIFDNVSTRYGAITLSRGTQQTPVIRLSRVFSEGEQEMFCHASTCGGAWMIVKNKKIDERIHKIIVNSDQKPRQGMNTGGLNKVFILEREFGNDIKLPKVERFVNGFGEKIELSTDFIFPLMGQDLFRESKNIRRKFILCLHDLKGNSLDISHIDDLEGVRNYLEKYKVYMEKRKGVLMQSLTGKGKYWSLLGVGPYSFTKFKVAWESLGKKEFRAIVLDGKWQGNQAMHAYIQSNSEKDAILLCEKLNKRVPQFLQAFGMEGTCNWAQPGRIKRMLTYEDFLL